MTTSAITNNFYSLINNINFRIQLAQINLLVGAIEKNTKQIIDWAQRACADKIDLIVFPELTLTGYPPEDLLLRSEFLIQIEIAINKIIKSVYGITIILGYPGYIGNKLYNLAGVIRDGALIATYAKQHLPNYSVFDEKRYFHSGSTPTIFIQNGIKIGLTICEDLWQEGPTQQAAAAGAQILLNLNASPFHIGKTLEREDLIIKRAREHNLAILYVNLVGGQDELVFDGHSIIVERTGVVVARAPGFVETTLTVECNHNVKLVASTATPLIDYAPREEMIYNALALGVRDYVYKNGFHGAVLGLSGGIDSALTLAIAADALGVDQITAVLMPSRYTSAMSNEDALAEVKSLGVKHQIIPIDSVFQNFLELLAPFFNELIINSIDVTEENLQARCRGIILMAISNKTGLLLLTTGNKSELAVGYATLYGDMAGGFAPLKDVSKTLVYQLARYRNQLNSIEIIPERVFIRPPSAELRFNQTDQDSLPPYDILDAILYYYIEENLNSEIIIQKGYASETVNQVIKLIKRNEYKRRQAPPGVRISQRAFGRDWRYPITKYLL